MRIAILSCFHPYRGGIAQFNADILKELGKSHEVRAFNFSRQYPSFLFPGKTQFVTEEDKEAVSVESEALLDTVSPLSWARTARAINEWGPDVLILRYWMSWFAPSLGYVASRMKDSCRVVAILDNVIPHEPHFFDKPLTKYFLRHVDGCVTLCKEVSEDLFRLKKDAVCKVIPHPVYDHFGEKIDKREAEKKLGIRDCDRNILFFGLIRDYKGLDILIDAFSRLDDSYQLIIAGEPYGSFEKYQKQIDSSPNAKRVSLFPNYISDSEVKYFFSAADVAVLPYRSATQSGINAIANHFELPMIVTDVGGLKETVGKEGAGIVCRECTPECVADAIDKYFTRPQLKEDCIRGIRKINGGLSWNRFCKELTEFAETIKK